MYVSSENKSLKVIHDVSLQPEIRHKTLSNSNRKKPKFPGFLILTGRKSPKSQIH